MRFINRADFPGPSVITGSERSKAQLQLKTFYSLPRTARGQQRFPFRSELWEHKNIVKGLHILFHGKCAYCEKPVDLSNAQVDHFRPLSNAATLLGSADPDHYYWLAYAWKNLYLSCIDCNKNKRNFFPVEGARATLPGTKPAIRITDERYILIDPCKDQPFEHLVFNEAGDVSALTNRGEITKEVLGLNSTGLILNRNLDATLMLYSWRELLREPSAKSSIEIGKSLNDNQPYLGMRRQLLARTILDINKEREFSAREKLFIDELFILLSPEIEFLKSRKGKKEAALRELPVADIKIGELEKAREKKPRTAYIDSIEIRNFKIIKNLRFSFQYRDDERAPWKVLLGENGCGKSTVLQAVALTLLGEDRLKELMKSEPYIKPSKILRWGDIDENGNREEVNEGYVRINFTGGVTPIEVEFTKENFKFTSGREGSNTLLNAYGTTRLLPREKMKETILAQNLFNPFSPLCDAKTWFLNLGEDMPFSSTAMAYKDLLNLTDDEDILVRNGEIYVKRGCQEEPLEDLSDGYQSVFALATDIIKSNPEISGDLHFEMGIVLLDEIGTYLHPRWKMDIVKSLREAFPRIQFLATTHEPLCLRGLEENEVATLTKTDEGIELVEVYSSPAGLRVDQLLTSSLFGLHSTIDPDLDKKFLNYYHLLALPNPTKKETDAIEELKRELSTVGVLGTTRRDQMVYELIDEYLARDLKITDKSKKRQLKEETKKAIAEKWRLYDLNQG